MQEDVRSAVPLTVTRKKTCCCPASDHQEEDVLLSREQSPGRRCPAAWTSSRGIAPQKPNHRTPRARFVGGRGFWRHLLSRCSLRVDIRDGEYRGAAELWSLGGGSEGKGRLTEDVRTLQELGGHRRLQQLWCHHVNSPNHVYCHLLEHY